MRNTPSNVAHNNTETKEHTQQMQAHIWPKNKNTNSRQLRSGQSRSRPTAGQILIFWPISAMTKSSTREQVQRQVIERSVDLPVRKIMEDISETCDLIPDVTVPHRVAHEHVCTSTNIRQSVFEERNLLQISRKVSRNVCLQTQCLNRSFGHRFCFCSK